MVLAYPTADRVALVELTVDHELQRSIMVDSPEHIDLVAGVAQSGTIQVCLDVDASLRIGQHLGVRRSPLHTADVARSRHPDRPHSRASNWPA